MRIKHTVKNFKTGLSKALRTIGNWLLSNVQLLLCSGILFVGLVLVIISLSLPPEQSSVVGILSGIATGLITSLFVTLIINWECALKEKQRFKYDRKLLLNKIIVQSLEVYEDIVYRVNRFIMYTNIFDRQIYRLYENFKPYNEFEKKLKEIDFEDAGPELRKEIERLFNINNYRIDYLVAELKRLPRQDYYLQGIITENEYRALCSAYACDTYEDWVNHLDEYWDCKIKDFGKCITFLRMTLSVCARTIDALVECKEFAEIKESAIRSALDDEYYYEIYLNSEEYAIAESQNAEAEILYYEEHPDELEALLREDSLTEEERLERSKWEDLYSFICGFSFDGTSNALDRIDPLSPRAKAFFSQADVQKALKKNKKIRKAIQKKFGREYMKTILHK